MTECYNTACHYCVDYQCRKTCTCDMRLDGEYVKVKHGRWKTCESGHDAICTNCRKYWIPVEDKYDYWFCPRCGARMDGWERGGRMTKDEAIEILSDMRAEYNIFGDETEATRYHVLSWAIQAMKAEPKHGRWEMYGAFTRGTFAIPIYRCSECKEDTNNWFWHYCPNCGAKMDLDEVEE